MNESTLNNSERLKPHELAKYIDHTLLKPDATKVQIRNLCEEALTHNFFAVCVNSSLVSTCKEVLKNSKIKIASVVGFPLGAVETAAKAFETSRVVSLGASEIDMVLNLGAVKAQDWIFVERDIKDVVHAANGLSIKVILETHLLNPDEIIKSCEVCINAGADFVKTSTGFNGGGATLQDVILMKSQAGNKLQVKASGGIKNFSQALALIKAGADRLGTSSGVQIVSGDDNSANKESY